MKKILFLVSVAAVALTGCTSESNEYVGDNSPKEIAFKAIATPTTRAAWDGSYFPGSGEGYGFKLAAYDATLHKVRFNDGDYTYYEGTGGDIIYKDQTTSRYWPLADTWLHFLGVSYMTTSANNAISTSFSSYGTNGTATVTLSDNSSKQNDLMYAIGNGHVQKSGNALTVPANVPMQFKHALASLRFTVQSNVASKITLNSITVNNAFEKGTFTITHTGYDNENATESVAGVWTVNDALTTAVDPGDKSATVLVPGISSVAVGTSVSSEYGLLVIPKASGDSFTSFTLNYTMDGETYNFEYTPATLTLSQGYKYIYTISFTLNEILVKTTVLDWTNGTGGNVQIPPTA